MGLVVWYGDHTMDQLEKQKMPVLELIQSITKLRNLQFDYLVSQENRTLTQWYIVYNQSLIQTSSLVADDDFSKIRIERINRAFKSLKILFESAIEVPNTSEQNASKMRDKFTFSYNLLNQQSLNAFDELSQMEIIIKENEQDVREYIELITLITFIIIPIITILSLLILFYRFNRGFHNLQCGTRILGSGDLTYRISIKGNDEFVNLSNSFNSMAEDLQKVLISRDFLNEAKTKAETANHSKSIFLANMSHELRTPLNAILGFSQLLINSPGFTPSQLSHIEIINRSGDHLLTIINDILDMAKIEAGKMTINNHPFNLHLLITGVFDLFSLQAAEHDISYTLDMPSTTPRYINSDEKKIRHILINLISNAIKFTQEGKIQVRVRTITNERKKAGDSSDNMNLPMLSIEVIDTGIGLAPETLNTIFEPFEQVTNGRNSSGGTGLGLAISRKYSDILKGTLTATSPGVKNLGSTFTLVIPYIPELHENSTEQIESINGVIIADNAEDSRILIVDDREENRELLASFHYTLGLRVRQVTSGEEAIECFRKWHPHLIWMDILMPGLRGDETMKLIRKEAGNMQPIIIAVTAGAFEEQISHFLNQGFNGYLQKPYTKQEVITLLKETLHITFRYQPPDIGYWPNS
jgi:signal transduction histidine kinase/ActR/RegA family two-component response regulator